MWLKASPYLKKKDFESAIGILCWAFFLMSFFSTFLLVNRKNLTQPEFKARYSNLYNDIHLTRDRINVLFVPIFLFRRLVFVCIPTILYAWPNLQL